MSRASHSCVMLGTGHAMALRGEVLTSEEYFALDHPVMPLPRSPRHGIAPRGAVPSSTRKQLHEFQPCPVRDATSAPQPWHDGWGDGTLPPPTPSWHRADRRGAIFYPVSIGYVATIPSTRNNRLVRLPQNIQPLDTPTHCDNISMLRSTVIIDSVIIPEVIKKTPAPPTATAVQPRTLKSP